MGLTGKKKGFDYFDAFLRTAKQATAAANFLHGALADFRSEGFSARVEEMHRIENAADAIKHEMMEYLAHEFITPIEREDIVSLAQELDTVVDSLDDVMCRVYMFNIQSIRPETLEFTALAVNACTALETAVAEFKHFKNSKTISGLIIEVNTLESRGDALHSASMRKLFTSESDARTLMIWMSLFESLEQCFDACEHASDVIESVIMKNT